MAQPQILQAVTVLPVTDIHEVASWYQTVLGFATMYVHEGATVDEVSNYAILVRDEVPVHLILDEPPPHRAPWTVAGTGYLYLKVRDAHALLSEVVANGASVPKGVETTNWGARGFVLTDPSGNEVRIEQAR